MRQQHFSNLTCLLLFKALVNKGSNPLGKTLTSKKIKQTDGCILRSFKRDLSDRKSLDPAALNKILKFIQRTAELTDIGELSGHSFRVGAAVDLFDKGVPLERVVLRGGWKSENTALRYLRNWDDNDWLLVT